MSEQEVACLKGFMTYFHTSMEAKDQQLFCTSQEKYDYLYSYFIISLHVTALAFQNHFLGLRVKWYVWIVEPFTEKSVKAQAEVGGEGFD